MTTRNKASSASDSSDETTKGKAAFEALLPRYRAIPAGLVMRLTFDPQLVAIAAIGVANRIARPELLARFKALPKGEIDHAVLADLPRAAWGLFYASTQAARLKAGSSEAQIPQATVQRALELELRMQACCEYYLADDPVVGPELNRLRPGTSYRDLASDLLGYATIYQSHRSVLKHDKKHYCATDADEATRLGEEMIAMLGDQLRPDEQAAADNLARAATFLFHVYAEVAATGRWLLRSDPQVDKLFPSLTTAGRAPRKTKKNEAEPAPEEEKAAADPKAEPVAEEASEAQNAPEAKPEGGEAPAAEPPPAEHAKTNPAPSAAKAAAG